jgi:hypothetical protein
MAARVAEKALALNEQRLLFKISTDIFTTVFVPGFFSKMIVKKQRFVDTFPFCCGCFMYENR